MIEELELLKSSGLSFKSIRDTFKFLHSGARAKHMEYGIERAQKMIEAYKGNSGMQWRVNRANKTIDNLTPKLNEHNAAFNNAVGNLSPASRTAANVGRSALAHIYDVPKMLTMHPNSITGMIPSIGVYTGAALTGLNIDPYARLGSAVEMANAKPVAQQYATMGGTQAFQDFQQNFDSLNIKDRNVLARDPSLLTNSVDSTTRNALRGKTPDGFRFSSLINGTPDLLDDTIKSQIANKIRTTQL